MSASTKFLWRQALSQAVMPDLSGAIEAAVLEELAAEAGYTFHLDSTGAAYLRGECVSKEGDPLYAAPVVQPDMVLVPREPTEAMLDAAMNRYQHISPKQRPATPRCTGKNFRLGLQSNDRAAAEGKITLRLTGDPLAGGRVDGDVRRVRRKWEMKMLNKAGPTTR